MTVLRTLARLALALELLAGGTRVALAADDVPGAQTFRTPTVPPARSLDRSNADGIALPRSSTDSTDDARATNGTQRSLRSDTQAPPAQAPLMPAYDLPPPKPGEFQKFIEAATGRMLPVFGSSFFTDAARTPMALDNVPVSADYTVGPGDELIIRAWGSIDVDYRTVVDRTGQLNLPKVGSFNVAGVRASDLERHLRAQIGRLYTNFSLSVSLGQLRSVRVFVVGPAQRPGVYTLPSQSTLLSAMAAAGGPASQGSMRKIQLKRDGRVLSELDMYEFLVQGDKSRDLQLAAGDVIVFQPAGPRVALTGATDSPAVYELRSKNEPLRELLRYAGGALVLANPHRVQVERIDPQQPRAARFVEEFKLDGDGLQKPLRDGDLITLLAISPQFANAVTLKGHVAQPLRYPFKPGMRINDLIPDREALISADFYRRKNLLVQVIDDAADPRGPAVAGNTAPPPPTGDAGAAPDAATGSNAASARGRSGPARSDDLVTAQRERKAPAVLFDELNWEYAVVERLNAKDLSTQVIPFNLGAAVLRGDATNNLELQPGDVVTIYSQKDVRVPVARQTRLVSLEGEVAAPGVYQLLPGETLRGLLTRAGGLTPQAYVFGLEFTREEARQRQRENLNRALARLEQLSNTQNARDSANNISDTSSSAVRKAVLQDQLNRLARLEPNGRIALELSPGNNSVESLPDVPLEQGDRILVPTRPGFVTVAGAVVNSNAFLWRPGRTAGDYLRLAGLDEVGDTAYMFVLRADGTVVHAADRRGLFGRSSLESQDMQPGDALIVPNQLDFETWGRALVRNLKDWSQIFSQFGLGAVALKSLR